MKPPDPPLSESQLETFSDNLGSASHWKSRTDVREPETNAECARRRLIGLWRRHGPPKCRADQKL